MCAEQLNIDENSMQDLLHFTRTIIYGDEKSQSMAKSRAEKWQASSTSLQVGKLLLYITLHPTIRNHPSPCGNGWEMVNGVRRHVRNT